MKTWLETHTNFVDSVSCSLEYWSFEMVVLLAGLLPNPKLETSVLSIRLDLYIKRHTQVHLDGQ